MQLRVPTAAFEPDKHPRSISLRGEAGTGKSIVAAALCFDLMELGSSCAILTHGPYSQGQQLLNQMLSVGLLPFGRVLRKELRVFEGTDSTVDAALNWIRRRSEDVIVVDKADLLVPGDPNIVEQELLAASSALGKTTLIVSGMGVSEPRQFELTIDLTRDAIEVEKGLYDAILTATYMDTQTRVLLRVGSLSLEVTQRM